MTTSSQRFDSIELPSHVRWSVTIGPVGENTVLFERQADTECATASIGKTLLLITVAQRLVEGRLHPLQSLSRRTVDPVADSGVWQHLEVDELPLVDVCVLTGAVSDNLATNVLIELVGLDAVRATGRALGLTQTALHDLVRDVRTTEHPRALSTGTSRELYSLSCELARPTVIATDAAVQVTRWLSVNTDLSMVAGAFGLDPLAHLRDDRGFALWNKTGTNTGVRCDIGAVSYRSRHLAWAALANWRVTDGPDDTRDLVLTAMRELGIAIRHELLGAT